MPEFPKTIREFLKAYQERVLSPKEVAQNLLGQFEKQNSLYHAFLHAEAGPILKRAEQLEKADRALPLYGVPIALKDIILYHGSLSTASSKILENYQSPYSATVAERLEKMGALVFGKTNCDEFAMGSTNENSAYGPVRNPTNPQHVAGGSSGGSAAAVASGMVAGALGTDTGGSIREPASFCGITGLKPTYGRVSRYGVMAYASSLDQVGPMAHTAWDAARILEAIAGLDPKDPTSSKHPVPSWTSQLDGKLPSLKVGYSENWLQGCHPNVEKAFREGLKKLESLGVKLVPIELPHAKYAVAAYYLIAPSEASSNLARYDGIHYGKREAAQDLDSVYSHSRGKYFGPEVKFRILLGTYALSSGYYDAYYLKANSVRLYIRKDFEAAFSKCDAIACPTAPTTAFKLGEHGSDPLKLYLADAYTIPVNLAGLPAISTPCGEDPDGLPIGIQFIGRHFEEGTVLHLAHCLEGVSK